MMMDRERYWYFALLIVLAIAILLPYLWPRPPQEVITIPSSLFSEIKALGTNPSGPTFIEFGDLASATTQEYTTLVEEVVAQHPALNYVWISLPSQQQISGQIASVLLECMRDQNRHFETLAQFRHLDNLTQQDMINAIARVGNASAAWECAQSGKKQDVVKRFLTIASQLHIVSTPTFFVNDQQIPEPYILEKINRQIEDIS